MYALLKHLHVTMAMLSFLSFFIRGAWMWRQSPLLQRKLVKVLPHIIDTLLLLSAIALAVLLHYSPMQQPWLMAKLIGIVVYIGFGVMAFKHRNAGVRKASWIAGLLVFAYIVSVAISKSPLGFFA